MADLEFTAYDAQGVAVASPSAPLPLPIAPAEMSLTTPYTAAELLRDIAADHVGGVPMGAATIWVDSPGGRAQPTFPLPLDAFAQQRIARYVASEANNLVVTRGGARLHVACPYEVSPEQVLQSIEGSYSQVYQLLTSPASVTASAQAPAWSAPNPGRPDSRKILPLPVGRPAIGINIGQTDTKVVIATDAGIRGEMRWRVPTFLNEASRDEGIAARVIRLTEVALTAADDPVGHVGLAIGGIVRAGAINRSSGVALGLDDQDYEALVALPETLRKRFGVDVSLVQDVEAKAHFHALRGSQRDCLVLDLGTSLGGAYIDEAGGLPAYLNQVGRIAFDLDEASVPRADGRGDGLLSQYLSARGIVRLAAAAGAPITDAAQLEDLLLSPSNRSESQLWELLRTRLQSGVALAARWYEPSRIMLTGGVVSGRFGLLAHTWLEGSGDYEAALSTEPLFDGCIGAAWIALSELST